MLSREENLTTYLSLRNQLMSYNEAPFFLVNHKKKMIAITYMTRYENHYFFLLSPSRNEPEYIVWLMELGAMRNNSDWAETSSPEKIRVTRPQTPKTKMNRWENNLFKTFCRLQHVHKQMQDVLLGEIHFEIVRVQIWTSVLVNDGQNLEQIQYCIVRVQVQPSV